MKKLFTQILPVFAVFFLLSLSVFAQTKVAGKVTDAASKESLIGVSIAVKGKVIGTITDANGNFSLTTSTPTPFSLVVSMVGYERQEIVVKEAKSDFKIILKEQATMGQDVVVSASRIEESVLQSPVSVEKMDLRSIRETPSASFYDALRNLKGVETSTQSVSFSSINMRGFNSNGNVRVVQLIDGMDNQAPGLNFSVGNIVGISELDLEGVEVLPTVDSGATCVVDDLLAGIKDSLNEDLNTPQVIAHLFELARRINVVNDGKDSITEATKLTIKSIIHDYCEGVLGMMAEDGADHSGLEDAMSVLLLLRAKAKAEKNWALSDQIRDELKEKGFEIKDGKEGTTWNKF